MARSSRWPRNAVDWRGHMFARELDPGAPELDAGPGEAMPAASRVLWLARWLPGRLTLRSLPVLRGERVILRERRESDIDDRLRYPIDPGEENNYGSPWRRDWD